MGQIISTQQQLATLNANLTTSEVGQKIFGTGQVRRFTANAEFRVPADVSVIRVTVQGGGGAGGITPYGSTINNMFTGGGAGGFSIGVFNVSPLSTYPVTIGAAGSSTSASVSYPVILAGTTSFGSLISATGGGTGNYGILSTGSHNLAGGIGGVGIGGYYNADGGRGGLIACSNLTNNSSRRFNTGGGAGFGGYRGGDIVLNNSSLSGGSVFSTGGGGTGGNGGDINDRDTPSATLYTFGGGSGATLYTFGGGSGGPGGIGVLGANIGGFYSSLLEDTTIYKYVARHENDNYFRGTGGGTGGGGKGASGDSSVSGHCGGAGGVITDNSYASGFGGGGGGVYGGNNMSRGAPGLCIVEW